MGHELQAPYESWAPVVLVDAHDPQRLLGVVHLPRPVAVGDAAMMARGPLLRVTSLVDDGRTPVAEVERVRLVLTG